MGIQDTRPVAASSPLGEDVLLFRSMYGSDQISQPFSYQLELLSKDDSINFADLLGQTMSVRLDLPAGGKRYFHGFVTCFEQLAATGNFATYVVTLNPWLWLLTQTANCRIFQEQTIPEIIGQVFRDHGFTDFEQSLSGDYAKWDYCVQYRESDFNFVSRLMEQEGIYYFFRHEENRHTMVLADSYTSHEKGVDYESVPYFPRNDQVRRERDHIFDWSVTQRVQPGKYTLDAFDFEKPRADLSANSSISRQHAMGKFEVYDYPGEYNKSSVGEHYARTRVEELQAQHEQIRGGGNAAGLVAGNLFDLSGFQRDDQNREYLLLSVSHQLRGNRYESETEIGGPLYECQFTALESKQPYRPARQTPKPMIQGVQTAVVVGKQGEEIWTDKYGRVKVQFHWDRKGKSDEKSSCWVRVAQMWAGKGWGGIHIPRIGQEVIVDFMEGDPDQPIITGRVYNGDQMPPYDLPANASQSGIKSRSTKDANAKHFNELRFEDKKDSEEVYFHAERDFTRVVENDDSLKVGFDTKSPGSQTIEIYQDRTTTIEKGDDRLTIKTGDQTTDIRSGKSTTEAAKSIELIVGQSSIKIEPSKITIKSPEIVIEGAAKVDIKSPIVSVKADAKASLEGAITQVKGSGMTMIEGALVKIN